jgi:hypothetical protein
MLSDTKRSWPEAEDRSIVLGPVAQTEDGRQLEVNVIFTTAQGTLAALKAAQELAHELNAQTVLRVPQVVPLQFSFSSPPVSIAFIERRAYAMAKESQKDVDISVQVYLCADKRKCLLSVLKPHSLVLVGGRRRWWPAPEQNLAKVLQASGHRVIFVNGE